MNNANITACPKCGGGFVVTVQHNKRAQYFIDHDGDVSNDPLRDDVDWSAELGCVNGCPLDDVLDFDFNESDQTLEVWTK